MTWQTVFVVWPNTGHMNSTVRTTDCCRSNYHQEHWAGTDLQLVKCPPVLQCITPPGQTGLVSTSPGLGGEGWFPWLWHRRPVMMMVMRFICNCPAQSSWVPGWDRCPHQAPVRARPGVRTDTDLVGLSPSPDNTNIRECRYLHLSDQSPGWTGTGPSRQWNCSAWLADIASPHSRYKSKSSYKLIIILLLKILVWNILQLNI